MAAASGDPVYIDKLQQLYAWFNQGNMPAILSLFTDDVEWTALAPEFAKALGVYRGKDATTGIQRFFADLFFQQSDELFQPIHYQGDGPVVSASGIEKGRWMNGKRFVNNWNHTIWFHETGDQLAYRFRANYNLHLVGPPTHAPFPGPGASHTRAGPAIVYRGVCVL